MYSMRAPDLTFASTKQAFTAQAKASSSLPAGTLSRPIARDKTRRALWISIVHCILPVDINIPSVVDFQYPTAVLHARPMLNKEIRAILSNKIGKPVDPTQFSPLVQAIANKDLETVDKLVSTSTDHVMDNDRSLTFAVQCNFLDGVRQLLMAGSDPNGGWLDVAAPKLSCI